MYFLQAMKTQIAKIPAAIQPNKHVLWGTASYIG